MSIQEIELMIREEIDCQLADMTEILNMSLRVHNASEDLISCEDILVDGGADDEIEGLFFEGDDEEKTMQW